jgi:hypothetical protein
MYVVELKRLEVINLYRAMNRYIAEVGKKADRLACVSGLIMQYEPNGIMLEEQNKAFTKLKKEAERKIKKAAILYAKIYEDGDKKGTFVLDERGEFTFTRENKIKLDEEVDRINDWYEEEENNLLKEKTQLYIEQAVAPEKLQPEYRNALDILIELPA